MTLRPQPRPSTRPVVVVAAIAAMSLVLGALALLGPAALAAPAASAKEPAPWVPQIETLFNYPLSPKPAERYRIRNTIVSAIRQSPPGSTIRISTFTFIDTTAAKALIAAYRRGVSVQMVVNAKNVDFGSFRMLRDGLRSKRRPTAPPVADGNGSFVKVCKASCRGRHGNLHSKLYLFSQVGATPNVVMVSSANLTMFAAEGQWNHLDVLIGAEEFAPLMALFDQMKVDKKAPYEELTMPQATAWVFPRLGTKAGQDPMFQQLRHITCKQPQPDGTVKRSVVRIGMYAWFDDRGTYLAKAVRQKWNQGCDIRVIWAVMSGRVTKILEDPHGRGRIPMARSVTISGGEVADYNHSKYVALDGAFDGAPAQLVWTGSMNFTQLGIRSDDIIVRLAGERVVGDYFTNFQRVWNSPSSIKPPPLPKQKHPKPRSKHPKKNRAKG